MPYENIKNIQFITERNKNKRPVGCRLAEVVNMTINFVSKLHHSRDMCKAVCAD